MDAEADGLPSANAVGDDLNLPDDEDGVVFLAALTVGSANNISVTASATGKLDAWIDFNRDGDWADAGEQIFASQSLVAGVNQLTVTVSANATVGVTFARFRFSSAGNLAPTGSAADGEVEDYRVTISAPVLSNLFAGLRFTPLAGATTMINAGGGRDPTMVVTPSTQPNSGVSFEFGQASGLQVQMSMQRENQLKSGLSMRLRGSQGGQSKDLVSVKSELSEFDASKNEVSIESIQIAYEGLVFEQTNVRFFDGLGRQIFSGHYPVGVEGDIIGRWIVSNTSKRSGLHLGDTGTHEVGHWAGFVSDMAQFADSPVGSGLHLVFYIPEVDAKPVVEAGTGIPAVVGAGRTVTLPDGKVIEGVTLGVVSFEGLKQPVEALERVEITITGGMKSFRLADGGLLLDGLRVSGGENTRLTGFVGGGQPGWHVVPEVGDTVLVALAGGVAPYLDGGRDALLTEFGLPAFNWKLPGSSLRLSTQQTLAAPIQGLSSADYWVDLSAASPTAGAQPQAATPNNFLLKLGYTGPNAAGKQFGVTIFNQGAEVTSLVTDLDLDQPDMALVGAGKPIRVLPGLRRSGEISVQTGITFDMPMTIMFGDKTFVGDELSFTIAVDGKFGPETERITSLRLRSPGQTEYRLTPQQPFDWGDLPAPYMTTAAQNGARHRIVPALHLGSLIDTEGNGRPSPFATGDDRFLSDDDDGVTFTSALVPGANATVNIAVVAPPRGAFLRVDLDFAANNIMTDPDDRVLDNKPVVNGINSFTFPVPVNAKLGKTYARFRLSFEGGLGPDGPAESGEVEDCLVQIVSAAPPAHPSGLTVVPRGGATLKSGASGALEVTGLTDGGDDGVTLLAPPNVVSRAAGRIIVPLNPPIPLSAFSSITQPFADGLVLEAHYTGTDGSFWIPRLSFKNGDINRPVIVGAMFDGHYGGGVFVGFTDVDRDGTSDIAHLQADSGEVGSFSGSANIIRLGWATFPSSALVIFNGNVTFTGVDGTKLTGSSFRFLALDETGKPYSPTGLAFTGFSLNGVSLNGGTLGISDLVVRNPKPPSLTSINLLANGTAALGFPTEPDVFYSLEATDSLASPSWNPPTTQYQFGSGAASSLPDPATGRAARFYRLCVE